MNREELREKVRQATMRPVFIGDNNEISAPS